MFKDFCKKLTSIILAMAMICPSSITSLATEQEIIKVQGTMLSQEDIPEEKNIVYFGATSLSVSEKDVTVNVPVYRTGTEEYLMKGDKITIHSQDISALYNKDYKLTGKNRTEIDSDKTILEKLITGDSDDEIGEEIATKSEASNKELLDEISQIEAEFSVEDSNTNGLAALKQKQTGKATREEGTSDLTTQLSEEILGDLFPEMLYSIMYSCEQVIEFKPGETESVISFKILNDSESEGSELFNLMIVAAEEAEPYEAITLSVSIEDDEAPEHSVLNFAEESFTGTEGSAMVRVSRTGALYSMATAKLKGKIKKTDPETGEEVTEEKIFGEFVFLPYEEYKEAELTIYDPVELELYDFKAADPGDRITASVAYDEEETIEYKSDEMLGATEESETLSEGENEELLGQKRGGSFPITIDKKTYKVTSTNNSPTGQIWDTSVDPNVEVGVYVFAADNNSRLGRTGWFFYGQSGSSSNDHSFYCSTHERGDMFWHNWRCWKKGYSWAKLQDTHKELSSVYYQYAVPDWEETGSGSREESWFTVTDNDGNRIGNKITHYYQFGRGIYGQDTISLKRRYDILKFRVAAADDSPGWKPDTQVYFHGIVLMYKRFDITTSNPDNAKFKVGLTEQTASVPFQFSVQCGVQTLSSDKRSVYANLDEKQTNLVFTTDAVPLSGGGVGKFGTIKGFKIRLESNSKDSVTLNYPEDFKKWLKGAHSQSSGCPIDYSADAIKKEIEIVDRGFSEAITVPYDKYFISWIESYGDYSTTESVLNNNGYYQKLNFTPVVELNNVKVSVLDPVDQVYGEKSFATFNDPALSLGEHVFHAGDQLDLSATVNPDKTEEWIIDGYDIMEEGGQGGFSTIRNGQLKKLEPNKNYTIRPHLAACKNRIEVIFQGDAASYLKLENALISQTKLKNEEPDLYQRNILNLNPKEESANRQKLVYSGYVYSINVLVKPEYQNDEYEYCPVITDKMTGKSYNGQRYDFLGRNDWQSNIFYISYVKVPKSSMKNYQVSGLAVIAEPSIVDDALGKHKTPAIDYKVIAGNGQYVAEITEKDPVTQTEIKKKVDSVKSIISDIDRKDGSFTLKNIRGKAGDRFTIVLNNGSADTGQVKEVVLGNSENVSVGELQLYYPSMSPRVIGLSYKYKIPENLNKALLSRNSIRILDDKLVVTATVNPNGAEVEKIRFYCTSVKGVEKYYDVQTTKANQMVYTWESPNKMLQEFNNGDHLSVSIFIKQNATIGGSASSISVELPRIQTGYVFYVENELVLPKEFSTEVGVSDIAGSEADIPLIGTALSRTTSGKLNLDREEWPDGGGFTLTVNLDAVLHETQRPVTIEDKQNAYKRYKEEVIKINKDNKEKSEKAKEGDIILPNENSDADAIVQNAKGKKIDKEELKKIRTTPVDQLTADQARADMNKGSKWTWHALFLMDLEFAYDSVKGNYYLVTCVVTIGGKVDVNNTWYTIIGKVPGYLNIAGGGNISLVLGGVTQKAQAKLTSGEFDKIEGNIFTKIVNPGVNVQLDVAARVKGQVGVGICGILGCRGFIQAGGQFQKFWRTKLDPSHGFILNGAGGFGLDLLFFSFEFNFINAKKGWGTLKKATEVTYWSNLVNHNNLGAGKDSDEGTSGDTEEILSEGNEENYFIDYTSGTDVSTFGQYQDLSEELLGAQPMKAEQEIVLTPAATKTRPQLLDLEDGRELLTFIGAKEEDQSSSVLYYSIRDLDGTWSKPLAVSDNGSYQSQSSLLKNDDKIYIAWLETGKAYKKDASKADKLSSMEIRMTRMNYDTSFGTLTSDTEKITDICTLPYLCTGISLSEENGRIFCSYLLANYQVNKEDENLSDLTKHYTTPAVTEVDAKSMSVIPYKTKDGSYNERLIYIDHPTIKDPLVLDYCTVAETIGSGENERELLISTFTVNENTSLQDDTSTELYLKIEDITGGKLKSYYPIRLTDNQVGESFPTLTKLEDELYLSWLSGGNTFHMYELNNLLEALFAPQYEEYEDPEENKKLNKGIRDAYLNADPELQEWYRFTAEELGVTEAFYSNSFYDLLNQDDLDTMESGLEMRKEGVHNITNHRIVSDGKDIYVLFTDLTDDEENNGVELYGMRYAVEEIESEEEIEFLAEGSVFSDPVQISNDGMVIDEMSVFMTKDKKICLASNFYEQAIGSDLKMFYGTNSLVHSVFVPVQSIKVKNNELKHSDILIPGTNDFLVFDVINEGLLPTEGFSVKVTEETPDGTLKVLEEKSYDVRLGTNETLEISVPWKVPSDADGTEINISVQETGVVSSKPYELAVEITADENLIFDYEQPFVDSEGLIHVTGLISNNGNKASKPALLQLSSIDYYSELNTVLVDERSIDALEPGQEISFDFSKEIETDYFDEYGRIEMKLELKREKQSLQTEYPSFHSYFPMVMKINGGTEVLKIQNNTSKKLTVEIAPWDELCETLEFGTLDPSIAEVSEDGTITARNTGITTVYVYDPANLLYQEAKVLVTSTPIPEDENEGFESSSNSLPSWVERNGTWKELEGGKWQYFLNGKPVTDNWVCIYNPYAAKNKNQRVYAWFHFDKDGWMQTGWLDDKDGNRYYLNPVSDGTKGYMVSGWKQLDGKWYYFSTAEGSGTFGALFRNKSTPDGYKVDGNGVWVNNKASN